MDCRGDELIQHNNRTAAQAVPFQYLINEQAKSILALQELQNEVGALLEFRDLVMDTFPHLRHKQASSPEPSSGSQGVGSGESRWEPGVRVRRKLQGPSSGWIAGSSGGGGSGGVGLVAATGTAPRSRSNSHGKGPKSGEPAAASSVGTVQDSGFCTESKDSSSTSSRTTMTTKNCGKDDDEDELWSLLEMIQDKGTKLKLEVESLQNRLLVDDERLRRRQRRLRLRPCRSLDDLQPGPRDGDDLRTCCSGADYDVFRVHVANVKRERDALLDRVTEMEAESLSNAAQIHRLLAELKAVVCENRELEERLCGGKSPSAAAAIAAATIAARKSSSSHNGGGFAPVQPESSTGPSSSSAGRDAFYTPSQHSACNLSSIELQCGKLHDGSSSASCASLSSSSAIIDDDDDRDRDRHRSRRVLLVRPSDPISRNLEGRAQSPALEIGSPTFAKRLGALDGVVSSPGDRIGKPPAPGFSTPLPKRTLAAILKTFNPIELQRHLITVSYENKNLVRQMEMLNISKSNVSNELNKSKEDNEELKFQLEEKRIELEGTMARVRLLQLHQEQQQHGPVVAGSQSAGTASTAATNNQWLDLVPSNPILPQIALPGTPSAMVSTPHANNNHLQQHHHHHHHLNHSQDENGGSSSTESAHQTRSGGRHGAQHQPSKIPVVKPSSCPVQPRPTSSYRGGDAQQCQSWTKCKSDQSLPRNWESINNKSNGGSSIGSGVGSGVKQRGSKSESSQNHHLQQHRSRRDSAGGGASLTRARSQNNHAHQRTSAAAGGAAKDFNRTASAAVTAGHQLQQLQQPAADDTNKPAAKKLFRRRNLVRQSRGLMEACKKPVLPAVDEVQEPPDSMAVRSRDLDDGEDDEFFFDSIESSLATSACSSRPPPPECDSIDLSQPDSSLTAT
ncbi:uncharacterized protein LOC132931018 [Rhopalosiphum padi]|uniref:uncharacterized protein LOC132931018 n=1 Tax=Rhopalosiphum padi TaxID=40932 RepID=UPI00298DB003|nr:uncharacterized protein LOC132931018 [Rhopalosiphum padi]